ncbi:sensor histidine kinase [Sinomicrobium soli]|uniref:sensor histidine kinase n=1 Tax=Sinomicrobium sp. N-1-3-6 TaxID=2219864 RepID=UPI001374E00B|nr:HAMP domain-containing sensor histidine kinase [Sinomicrobium sp. N-1-3-6]
MKKRSLKNYTLRYLVVAILAVIALWAALFYWYIIEEVYDNIDDGLKDSKLRITREIKASPELLETGQYGIAQFRFTPLPGGDYSKKTHIYNSMMYMPYDDDDEPVRVLQSIFKENGQYYQLEIYTSTVEEDELLEDLLTALVVLYLALVGSIILINHFILRKAWTPFYRLLRQLQGYRIGSGQELEKPYGDVREFDELYGELRAMTRRNETIYTQQKQFIANASHELQTPLAIAANKLELIMGEGDLSEDQLVRINDVNQTLHRMKRLNRSLLTLSRIDNRQFQASETVVFNDLVQESLADLQILSSHKNILVSTENNGSFTMEMNRDLAVILLNNLLKNAMVHNPEKGTVNIRISDKELSIYNSGETPLDPQKIFRRFYKDEQNPNSTGLGLAIVQSIVSLYPPLSVSYRFDRGHCFLLHK